MHFKINDEQVIHQVVDDEVIIIHMLTGNYYSLGGSGVDIWNRLIAGATLSDLCDHLAGRYLDPKNCLKQSVSQFLDNLLEENIVVGTETVEKSDGISPDSHPEGEQPPEFCPPVFEVYSDVQDLLLLDPIHDVSSQGWPHQDADEDSLISKS